jgi:hypothetical protein
VGRRRLALAAAAGESGTGDGWMDAEKGVGGGWEYERLLSGDWAWVWCGPRVICWSITEECGARVAPMRLVAATSGGRQCWC